MQLDELTDTNSEAHKVGYHNICEIGKERIRRAGRKIKEELQQQIDNLKEKQAQKDRNQTNIFDTSDEKEAEIKALEERFNSLDTGFRVLRLDSSNIIEESYMNVEDATQTSLFADNIKADRTDLDLLFGCMVSWGVELSSPIKTEEHEGSTIYHVNNNKLIGCFSTEVSKQTIRHIAEQKPEKVIFRESCFLADKDKINLYEVFKQICGWSSEEAYNNIYVM